MREPVDRSEQRWQPVLVNFTVSIKEHDDDSLGVEGTDVSGPDQALTFRVSNQTDLKQARSQCKWYNFRRVFLCFFWFAT